MPQIWKFILCIVLSWGLGLVRWPPVKRSCKSLACWLFKKWFHKCKKKTTPKYFCHYSACSEIREIIQKLSSCWGSVSSVLAYFPHPCFWCDALFLMTCSMVTHACIHIKHTHTHTHQASCWRLTPPAVQECSSRSVWPLASPTVWCVCEENEDVILTGGVDNC